LVERPSGITAIAGVDGVTGILAFLLGLLSTGIIPIIDVEVLARILPNSSIMMAFGIVCIVGGMGLVRMSAWGYFMTMLVRFLSIMFLLAPYLVLPVDYIVQALLTIPEIIIVGYLIRMRGFFFEPVISPVTKANEEPDIPELPNTLTMPSEQAARAKEIEEVLSTPKPTPRICPQCGEQNPLEAIICSHCGGHLEATTTANKTTIFSKKARRSGKENPMVFCIYCGTKNGDEAEYCFRCGKKMWKT